MTSAGRSVLRALAGVLLWTLGAMCSSLSAEWQNFTQHHDAPGHAEDVSRVVGGIHHDE